MKLVLVAVDGSPRSEGVIDASIFLGRATGTRLLLFTAVGLPDQLPDGALALSPGGVSLLLERKAQETLDRLQQRVPIELRCGTRVAMGAPWVTIERVSAEEEADLIVIGSHGYGALDRVLGTTAAKVVNHADRSVLVVRDPGRITGTEPR